MTTYVGLALSASMFKDDGVIKHTVISIEQIREVLSKGYVSCCNPSHAATLERLYQEFNLKVDIPEKAPFVDLNPGDSIIILTLRFSERKTEERDQAAVQKAQVSFHKFELQ